MGADPAKLFEASAAVAKLAVARYVRPQPADFVGPPQLVEPPIAPELERGRRRPLVCETDWTVVDHVCRSCFGRLVGRAGESGRFYRCTNCGASSPDGVEPTMHTAGRGHPAICACAMRFGARDAGMRCVVNDRRSPDNPAEIVVRQL